MNKKKIVGVIFVLLFAVLINIYLFWTAGRRNGE